MGRRLLYLIDPKKPRKPIRLGNPLYAKERRVGSLHGGGAMARLLYGPLFLSLALAAMALYGGPQYADLLRYVAQVLVSFQLALIALVVPSLTTAAISSEVETGTFELLRLSPLRGGQVFWGKFLPALLPALLPNLALLPAYGAVVFIDPAYAPHFLRMLPLIVLAVAVCLVLGLACSAMVGQTSRATVVAYLLTAVLFLLPLLAWWAGGEVLSPRAAAVLAFWGPLVMALNLLPQSAAEIHGLYAYHLGVMGGLGAGLLLISRARLAILLRRGT